MENRRHFAKPSPKSNGRLNDGKNGTEDSTDVSDVDVNMPAVVPESVQSIITQVDRNAPPATTSRTPVRGSNSTSTMDMSTEYRAVNAKPHVRRSVFSRFFCCASKDSTAAVAHPGRRYTAADGNSTATTAPMSNAAVVNATNAKPSQMPQMERKESVEGKKLLALDLDETLVHSSFQPVEKASFIISVTIEGIVHNVYVIKRPGCDEFLRRLAEHYELVIYTASLSKYADPLLDILDVHNTISQRLFRENCVFYDGHYVKDLSLLNREITQTIIVDNSPMSYIFHPENAIDCSSFFDDLSDIELWQIADFLINIKNCADVRTRCRHWREWCKKHPSVINRTSDLRIPQSQLKSS